MIGVVGNHETPVSVKKEPVESSLMKCYWEKNYPDLEWENYPELEKALLQGRNKESGARVAKDLPKEGKQEIVKIAKKAQRTICVEENIQVKLGTVPKIINYIRGCTGAS